MFNGVKAEAHSKGFNRSTVFLRLRVATLRAGTPFKALRQFKVQGKTDSAGNSHVLIILKTSNCQKESRGARKYRAIVDARLRVQLEDPGLPI